MRDSPHAARALLIAEFGLVPSEFGDVWALAELLWQRKVGTHLRAKEREEEREAQRKADAYRKSVAELKRRQQE